jgi:hypothetical protein
MSTQENDYDIAHRLVVARSTNAPGNFRGTLSVL